MDEEDGVEEFGEEEKSVKNKSNVGEYDFTSDTIRTWATAIPIWILLILSPIF